MATFIGIAISLGISGWVYGDAKSRNSSHPMLWAVSVFCLLIVFLPLYFVLRPARQPPASIRREPMLCPYCGKYYEPPVAFCPNCGNKITN